MTNLIPDSFINSLLARVDIVDVINARIPLQKKGKNYTACCPFHTEKTPSFSVDQQKQFYHCFGCNASGDAIKFLRDLDQLTFVEAIEVLASQLGLKVPTSHNNADPKEQVAKEIYEVLNVAAEFFHQQLKNHATAKIAVDYLKARGLDGTTAKNFKIGYAPPGWENLKQYVLHNTSFTLQHLEQAGLLITKETSAYDRFRNRIMFPIRDRKGRVIGFGGRVMTADEEPKYLNSPETAVFNKGKELYGLWEAKSSPDHLAKLVVVEGYMDVVALAQAGINNVVAILGTALTAENIKLLFRLVSEIIFCFDADNAGRKAAWRALEVCLPNITPNVKVNFLFLPEAEDPDSYIRKYGKDKFLEQITRAASLADFLFRHLANQMDLELTEDRAVFAVRARELLQQIPDGVLKHMLFDRLADLAGLDRAVLTANTKSAHFYGQNHRPYNKNMPTQGPKSPTIFALALLLMYRELIVLLQGDELEYCRAVDLPGAELFFAVVSILKATPKATFAEISASLPVDLAKRFAPEELRGFALFVPTAGVEKEFLGIIAKIKMLYDDQKLELLLVKAKLEGLSATEKVQLQQLLLNKGTKYVAE